MEPSGLQRRCRGRTDPRALRDPRRDGLLAPDAFTEIKLVMAAGASAIPEAIGDQHDAVTCMAVLWAVAEGVESHEIK